MLNELDLDPVSDELPIACKLSGNELAERGEEVDELFKEVEQVRELADGYAFRFAGTAAMASSLLQFTLVGPALRKVPRSRKVDKCGTVFF